MNVTTGSAWDLTQAPSAPGISALTQFASTEIPRIDSPSSLTSIEALKSALQKATGTVRRLDLCPQIGEGQSPQLKIIPFKEIPNFVQAGDVVSFVTTDDSSYWRSGDIANMVKQRGWHAEIITPKQGSLILHGQWYGDDMATPINDVKRHPHYGDCAGIFNLHIFRFSPPKSDDKARFSALMQGLEAWGMALPRSTWPADATFNPVLFSDAAALIKLGDSLIQRTAPPPTMVCIEWVHAVFSLACCYPLTKKFLSGRGLLTAFVANFPGVQLLNDSLEAFDTLPWAPYHPSYIIRSFLDTYFAEDLSEVVIQGLPEVAQLPYPVIMPIAPLLEMRNRGNPSNFDVEYVCTAVADERCVSL